MLAGVTEMEFLVNDLSLHGQFPDISSFRSAVQRVMEIRRIVQRFGRSLYCNRNLLHTRVTIDKMMQQAVQVLTKEEQRVLMQWFTQHGPFWEDARNHTPDDWFESDGCIVTDSAIGEAAWCCLNGIERGLVSFTPSNWQFSPVAVDWVVADETKKSTDVMNHWEPSSIEVVLQAAPSPMNSWSKLEEIAKARFVRLSFAVDAFVSLHGHPFVSSAAQRLLVILDILNRYKCCFDEYGNRTREGNEIYQNYFTGKKEGGGRGSLFSDSSDSEKVEFKQKLTFVHPGKDKQTLFCSWHGKVQTPQLRIHFSSPILATEPLYIVYVGPKITKQ